MMVVMNRIDSSNIFKVGYNPVRNTLHVEFVNGQRYRYSDVMPSTFARFMNAPSKGTFLNKEIKPRFVVRQLNNDF